MYVSLWKGVQPMVSVTSRSMVMYAVRTSAVHRTVLVRQHRLCKQKASRVRTVRRVCIKIGPYYATSGKV